MALERRGAPRAVRLVAVPVQDSMPPAELDVQFADLALTPRSRTRRVCHVARCHWGVGTTPARSAVQCPLTPPPWARREHAERGAPAAHPTRGSNAATDVQYSFVTARVYLALDTIAASRGQGWKGHGLCVHCARSRVRAARAISVHFFTLRTQLYSINKSRRPSTMPSACIVAAPLAYAMLAYTCASLMYLTVSSVFLETPFRDSLSTQQLCIKRKSARQRGALFAGSLALSCGALWLLRPLRSCPR